jgi:hypothetical protein
MTAMSSNPALIWDRLLKLVDELNDRDCTIENLEAHLLSIEEGFSSAFDPADHYAEYVAVTFCRALRQRIERAELG